MRYITLQTEEIEALERLHRNSPNNTVCKRSQCLLLSHQGRTIIDLSNIFDVNRRTIERWFHSWAKSGLDPLPIQHGRGVKTRLKKLEPVIIKQLEDHNRNLKNILVYLKEQHHITICKKTLQNFLKDTGLLYLEKSPVLLPAAKGKFLNVVSLMNRKNDLFFEVNETTFNTDKFICFMNKFADQIVKKTVVILDNSPIHKSKKFMAKIREWEENDLLIFFLLPYSPELNLIEILWQRIKYQWLPFDAYLCF